LWCIYRISDAANICLVQFNNTFRFQIQKKRIVAKESFDENRRWQRVIILFFQGFQEPPSYLDFLLNLGQGEPFGLTGFP
jgi:hypothetical protein